MIADRLANALIVAMAVTLFWGCCWLFFDSVPVTTSVLGYDLPRQISRFADIICLPLAFVLTASILASKRLMEKSERQLAYIGDEEGFGIAMTALLLFSTVILIIALIVSGLTALLSSQKAFWILAITGLIISQAWNVFSGSSVCGLWASTVIGAGLCLIYGLVYGFAIGLAMETAFIAVHLVISTILNLFWLNHYRAPHLTH